MDYFKDIREAAEKFGFDHQEALSLHKKLCNSSEPGAAFAAQIVLKVIALTAEAEATMKILRTLAEESKDNSK